MTRKRTTENELVVSGAAAPAPRRSTSRPRTKHTAAGTEASAAAQEAAQTTPPATTSSVTTNEPAITAAVATPAHEEIARLAYSYWETRGFQGGSPEEDWLRAESEIRTATVVTL